MHDFLKHHEKIAPFLSPGEAAEALETERLLLRPFRQTDYPLILRISSDPDTVKYLYHWGHPGMTPEADAQRFLSYALAAWDKRPIRAREYCILLKETGAALGDGSVEYWGDDAAEIGWILTPENRGKGYVTEMGRELIRYAFESMQVRRVIAHCDARNQPSYRVMERLGMHLEATERECRPAKAAGEKKGDEYTYALTRQEWKGIQQKKKERGPADENADF